MFVLTSETTIGDFRFAGVHEVVVRRSIHSIVEKATIKVPSIATMVTNGRASPERVTTGKLFKEGDEVTIRLGYNDDLKTEFKGYVKQRKLDMPLEIECEGNSWLLRRASVNIGKSEQTIKQLLATMAAEVPKIKVRCDTDLELVNMRLKESSAFDLVNSVSAYTDENVSCFFMDSDTLWCGLLYTAAAKGTKFADAATVVYRTGYNTLRKNTLVPHDVGAKPGIVEYTRKRADGEKIIQLSAGKPGNKTKYSRIMGNIKDAKGLKTLADEKVNRNTYTGFEGWLESLLQPYAAPGYIASLTDSGYPELDGNYLIESTEVTFGQKGARRVLELGPRISL